MWFKQGNSPRILQFMQIYDGTRLGDWNEAFEDFVRYEWVTEEEKLSSNFEDLSHSVTEDDLEILGNLEETITE